MNLRLGKNSIRFRITTEELRLLEAGQNLKEEVILPNSRIAFQIIVGQCQEIELNTDNNIITLSISKSILKRLIESFPSREGINQELVFNDNRLKVALEVDIMKRRKAT